MFAELMRTKEKVGRADIAQIAGVQLGKLRARIEKYNVAARRANAALAIRLPILPDDL
jgi:hypothetical protein